MKIKSQRFFITLTIALVIFLLTMKSPISFLPKLAQPSSGFLDVGYVGGPIRIHLNLELILPNLSVDDDPKIEITGLSYQIVDKVNAKTICFDSILVADTFTYTQFGKIPEFFYTDNLLKNSLPLCFEIDDNEIGGTYKEIDIHGKDLTTDMFIIGPDSFWYPFDSYFFDFAIKTSFHLLNDDGTISQTNTTPETLFINPSDKINWNTKVTSKRYLLESEEINPFPLDFPYEHVNVSVSRPIYLRIAYPVLIGFIILFIALLSAIDNTEVFIETSVGLLFGIFGIKQLLEPPNATIRTFLDVALIMLYLLFALVLTQHIGKLLISGNLKTRKEDNILIGSKTSHIVHKRSCRYSHLIPEDQLSNFINLNDAAKKGFRPCKMCFPEGPQEKEIT